MASTLGDKRGSRDRADLRLYQIQMLAYFRCERTKH